jgi:hypothetical protein
MMTRLLSAIRAGYEEMMAKLDAHHERETVSVNAW